MPVSTPAGMCTVSTRSICTRCWPRHVGQNAVIVWPAPWQRPHVLLRVKKPCWKRSWPAPLQLGQVLMCSGLLAPLPRHSLQISHKGILRLTSLPLMASSKARFRRYSMSEPRVTRRPPGRPPKKSSKMSLKISPKPCPNPSKPCGPSAWPKVS